MWYTTPAAEWKEGLPIGNGALAAMVLGGVEQDRVALNHEWLWRAQWRRRDIGPRHGHLKRIRELFFAGKVLEAGTLANETLGGLGLRVSLKPSDSKAMYGCSFSDSVAEADVAEASKSAQDGLGSW
jgi:hypothetical protein